MTHPEQIINDMIDIGGRATINNFCSRTAKTAKDGAQQSYHYMMRLVKGGYLKQLPFYDQRKILSLSRRRGLFYATTKKGYEKVHRGDEYRAIDPLAESTFAHTSAINDILLSFKWLYQQFTWTFIFNKSLPLPKPIRETKNRTKTHLYPDCHIIAEKFIPEQKKTLRYEFLLEM